MKLRAEVDRKDLQGLFRDLELLTLTKERKKELLVRTLRILKRASVKQASSQRAPDGKAWKPRKQGTAKMLRRIARLFNSKAEGDQGRLFFSNGKTGRIAEEHQYGLDHEHEATAQNGRGIATGNRPATVSQAKKLRDLGYRKKIGGREKRLSIKEIQQQLSFDQAGVIIRKMQSNGEIAKGLKRWTIPTEKRPFLDEREQQNTEIIRDVIIKYLAENNL